MTNTNFLLTFSAIGITEQTHESFFTVKDNIPHATMTWYSSVKIGCEMTFKYFPFDTQTCSFIIGTDSAPKKDIILQSSLFELTPMDAYQEFQVASQPITADFNFSKLIDTFSDDQNLSFSATGVSFSLKRNWLPYFWTYFLPVFFMSLICSFSFLINPEIVPGRVALLLTLMLVLINFFNGIQEKIPRSKELTAIGIYLLGIIILAFFSLFEYAILLLRARMRQKQKSKQPAKQNHAQKTAWEKNGRNGAGLSDFMIDQISWVIYITLLAVFHLFFFLYIQS